MPVAKDWIAKHSFGGIINSIEREMAGWGLIPYTEEYKGLYTIGEVISQAAQEA